MAKYPHPDIHASYPEYDRDVIQVYIANELAEANRLKRLELKDKFGSFDPTEGIIVRHEKELEDQA